MGKGWWLSRDKDGNFEKHGFATMQVDPIYRQNKRTRNIGSSKKKKIMQQLLGENWEEENRERDIHCRKLYFNNSKLNPPPKKII